MSYMFVDKSHLVQDLKSHVIEIVFDRVDGDRRIMKCTLMPGFLPEEFRSHDAINRSVNSTDQVTLHVWDVNVPPPGWRTIKLDRVLSAQITNH